MLTASVETRGAAKDVENRKCSAVGFWWLEVPQRSIVHTAGNWENRICTMEAGTTVHSS